MSKRKNKKYSKELKHEAVQAYLKGEGSLRQVCRQYGLEIKSSCGIGFCGIMVIRKSRRGKKPEWRSI